LYQQTTKAKSGKTRKSKSKNQILPSFEKHRKSKHPKVLNPNILKTNYPRAFEKPENPNIRKPKSKSLETRIKSKT
jgi:hypothetical protein